MTDESITEILARAEKRLRKWGSGRITSLRAMPKPHSPEEEAELFAALKRLAATYLESSPEARTEIRSMFDDMEEVRRNLPSIGERIAEEARRPKDADLIRVALALVSMNDLCTDRRDVQISILGIVAAARRAKIKPRPLLHEVAGLSNEARNDMRFSMREFLNKFA